MHLNYTRKRGERTRKIENRSIVLFCVQTQSKCTAHSGMRIPNLCSPFKFQLPFYLLFFRLHCVDLYLNLNVSAFELIYAYSTVAHNRLKGNGIDRSFCLAFLQTRNEN